MGEGTEENIFKASMQHQNKLSNRQYFQKFEFYLVSLTFTVLGLSIQTAKFGNVPIVNIFELSAWVFLLVSGVFALFKLKKIYSYFPIEDEIVDSWVASNKDTLMKFNSYQKKLKKQSIFQWTFFIFGFIALIISRGYVPFLKIIGLNIYRFQW